MARPPWRFGSLPQLAPGHLSDQHGDPPPPDDRQPTPHQGGVRSVLHDDLCQANAPGPAGSGHQHVALNSTGLRLQTFQRVGMEGTMSRYKRIIGDTVRSHARPAQEVETRIAVTVLNRMLDLGRPESVRAA